MKEGKNRGKKKNKGHNTLTEEGEVRRWARCPTGKAPLTVQQAASVVIPLAPRPTQNSTTPHTEEERETGAWREREQMKWKKREREGGREGKGREGVREKRDRDVDRGLVQ